MMRRDSFVRWVALIVASSALTASAETLESVEKALTDAWQKHKTITAKFAMDAKMGPAAENKGDGTFEVMNQDNKTLIRLELKTTTVMKMGDQTTKMEGKSTTIVDEKYSNTLMESMGQTMATRSKVDPKMTGDPKGLFTALKKDHTLKLLPEEKIAGQTAYAIEATPKEPAKAEDGGMSKIVFSFLKDTGAPAKVVAYGADGKPMMTTTYSEWKYDVKLDPERFVFKLPPGVKLMDADAMRSGQGMPAQP